MKFKPVLPAQKTLTAGGSPPRAQARSRKPVAAAAESHPVRALLAQKRRAQTERDAHRQVRDFLHGDAASGA